MHQAYSPRPKRRQKATIAGKDAEQAVTSSITAEVPDKILAKDECVQTDSKGVSIKYDKHFQYVIIIMTLYPLMKIS